jgi:hypothetical protein
VTNPEQAPDIDLEAEDLTDENLDEVSGGASSPHLFRADPDGDALTTGAGGNSGVGGRGGLFH